MLRDVTSGSLISLAFKRGGIVASMPDVLQDERRQVCDRASKLVSFLPNMVMLMRPPKGVSHVLIKSRAVPKPDRLPCDQRPAFS
jgi:hypothetical protein